MGKLDDLIGKRQEDEQAYEDVEMSLMCGTCHEPSFTARRAVGTGIVGWKCPKGHKNVIEGLNFQ